MRKLIILILLVSLSALAQRPDYKQFGFAHDYDRIFKYVDKLMARDGVTDLLEDIFVEELIVPDELVERYNLSSNKVNFTENQLVFLLSKNESLFETVDNYLKEFPENVSLEDLVEEFKDLEKRRKGNKTQKLSGELKKRWEFLNKKIEKLSETRQKFHAIIEAPGVKDEFMKLSDPFHPVELKMNKGAPGWGIDVKKGYVTTFEKEVDGVVKKGDNAIKFVTDQLDAAEKSIKVMVFEQDLPELLESYRKALMRGVEIEVGLDGKHINTQDKLIYHGIMQEFQKEFPAKLTGNQKLEKIRITEPDPHLVTIKGEKVPLPMEEESKEKMKRILEELREKYPKQKGKKYGTLDYRPVTTSVGLDHAKLVVIDVDVPGKAKTIVSTGNFTKSGIHPEGDILGLPDKVRQKNMRPNANQMHVIDSDLYSLVTKHEIDKTFKKGLRGKGDMWATSYYEIKGPKIKGQTNPAKLVFTYTPGGLDDPMRFFMTYILQQSEGTLDMLLFAASSEDMANSVVDYLIKEFAKGNDKPFRSIMDTSFSTRFYSLLFKIGGYEELYFDEAGKQLERSVAEEMAKNDIPVLRKVIDDPDSYAMKMFDEDQLKTIREQMKLASNHYKETHFLDMTSGKNVKVTSKIHLKVAYSDNMVLTGSSNFSPSAATNKEAIVVFIDHPEVVEAQKQAGNGLHSLSNKTVADRIDDRNFRFQMNFQTCSELFRAAKRAQ